MLTYSKVSRKLKFIFLNTNDDRALQMMKTEQRVALVSEVITEDVSFFTKTFKLWCYIKHR